jgi:hypothetical protein
MRRWLAITILLAGCGGSGAPPAAPARGALLGFVAHGQRQELVRVGARASGGLDAGTEGCASRDGGQACWGTPPWSFSPDRSRLALARNDEGVVDAIRIVDPNRLRATGTIPLSGGSVGLLDWRAPDRLLAVQELCCSEREQLLTIDVARRRVLARRPLAGTVVRVARTPRALVLLMAPAQEVGPAWLTVADGGGVVRTIPLGGMVAGTRLVDRTHYTIAQNVPGLAVEPRGRRAFVAAPGLVTTVDLATGAIARHGLTRQVSLLGRLHDLLDPPAYAKEVSGPIRTAALLGDGTLAVTGTDGASKPAGLILIDTASWTYRTLDSRARELRVDGAGLLSTGADGLALYDPGGHRKLRALAGRDTWIEQAHGDRAYVFVNAGGGRVESVDLRTAAVRRSPEPATLVSAPSGSWWEG